MRQPNLPLDPTKALPSVQLIHGDCLEVMPTLPEKSIAMCFADLPYQCTQNFWDVGVPLSNFWAAVKQCVKADGLTLFTAVQPFASALVTSNLPLFRYDLIWEKTAATGHLNAKKRPLRAHEHILIFGAGKLTYIPQMTKSPGPRKRHSQGAKQSTNYGLQSESIYDCGGKRYPRSVLKVGGREIHSGDNRTSHPTQKPVALLEYLILTFTNKRDTVLDPVFGSAATAIACLRTGRNFVGIEKNAEYFRIGSERVAAEQERLANL